MTEILLRKTFAVTKGDFATAGEASGTIKGTLKKLGVDTGIIRRVAIASYEAELNLVIHSEGGELELLVTPRGVTVATRDVGPGIEDIELAMREGYSTASDSVREMGFGAGMGLANMKRCASHFHIESQPGTGTTVTMEFTV